jgi:para-nitrobenzyl esterase
VVRMTCRRMVPSVEAMRPVRIIVMLAAVLAAFGALTGAVSAQASPDRAVVVTDAGILRGAVAVDHRTFSGLPYAAPPIGDRRWRAPSPPARWRSVRDATRPGSPCPYLGGPDGSQVVGSEDCLYLNVTTPVPDDAHRLPVMVWLPGGGFVFGAGSDYDPTRLAVQGRVVVVTVNYRLGALGFLDHPALAATEPDAGNFGLADQQAALRWVRRNIARFGGDPHNVTLFGQSAGAFSVCTQLASPSATGLFQKAIVQSGPCGNSMLTRSVAEDRGVQVATDLGCSVPAAAIACLRDIPATRLVGIGGDRVFTSTGRIADLPWLPVAGTPMLPHQPLDAIRQGVAARVPLLQGSTRDEMRPFVAVDHDAQGRPVSAAQYPTILAQVFGADAPAVQARYPLSAYPSPGVALATVLTDWGRKLGACPVLPADQAAARRNPVYAYEFAEDNGQKLGDLPLGAAHAAELPYLFDGAFDGPGTPTLSPQQRQLSRQMIAYWSNFAASGDPNGPALPHWSAYQSDGRLLSLTAGPNGITLTDFSSAHQCGFWSTMH